MNLWLLLLLSLLLSLLNRIFDYATVVDTNERSCGLENNTVVKIATVLAVTTDAIGSSVTDATVARTAVTTVARLS